MDEDEVRVMPMRYTFLIFFTCTLVFILQSANSELTGSLALRSQNISGLFTYMFAHSGLYHYLLNMLALFAFGTALEEIIGYKTLLLFFVAGVLAGLASLSFYAATIGASGAIYGLVGAAALLRPGKETVIGVIGVPMPLIIVAIIYAVFDVLGLFVYTGVANIAHLGGLLVGVAFAIKNKSLASPV